MEEQIELLLQELRSVRTTIDALDAAHKARIQEILGPVAGQLEEANRYYAELIDPEIHRQEGLERQIRELVLQYGRTYTSRAAGLQAVFGQRTNWDTERLKGLALAYPAINECMTVTAYVQIREWRGGNNASHHR